MTPPISDLTDLVFPSPIASLLRLQGDIKTRFIEMGQPETAAVELACEAVHLLASSDAVKDDVRVAYLELGHGPDEPQPVDQNRP